jgi:hypothetical protein
MSKNEINPNPAGRALGEQIRRLADGEARRKNAAGPDRYRLPAAERWFGSIPAILIVSYAVWKHNRQNRKEARLQRPDSESAAPPGK